MQSSTKIGIVGDYDAMNPRHLATNAALEHSANTLDIAVKADWLSTDSLDEADINTLRNYHG